MLVIVSCGHLEDDDIKKIENAFDHNSSEVRDWIRYKHANWLLEYPLSGSEADVDRIRKIVHSGVAKANVLVSPMHYFAGWLDQKVWDFVKKYNRLAAPESANTANKSANDTNSNIISPEDFILKDADDLDDLKLNEKTKMEVDSYLRRFSFSKAAASNGIRLPNAHRNLMLPGHAGVGKTTLAKALALQLKSTMDVGHKINAYFVKPSQLIGVYRGHTQINMQTLLDAAQDGIIVFDEIDSYLDLETDGQIVLNTLNTHLGDKPNYPTVIGTLYASNLERFYNANKGFRSRFPYVVKIEGQDDQQLTNIFKHAVSQTKIELHPESVPHVTQLLSELRKAQPSNFGYIRAVDNVLGKIIDNLGERYAEQGDDFTFEILPEDVPVRDPTTKELVKNKSMRAEQSKKQQTSSVVSLVPNNS